MRRRSLVAGIVISLFVAALVARRGSSEAAALPYYEEPTFTPSWTAIAHTVAPFTARDQNGVTVTSADLAGHPYVASFIYTRCSVICPALVSGLRTVQPRIADPGLTVLSFSVTPDLDSPSVLAAFARDRHIASDRWKLLTGTSPDVRTLARDSFFADDDRLRASLGEPQAFLHTEKVVLVDGAGHLRGVYNGTQRADLDHLVEDANALLRATVP